MRLLGDIHSDYRRYRATGVASWAGVLICSRGFWATCCYRIASAFVLHVHIPIVRPCLRAGCLLVQLAVEIVTGISLPPECEIGPGLYIGHFGPVILNSGVRLGHNCNLSQGVTVGIAGRGPRRGCPIIGDRVYIGVNAVLIGQIEIGNDAAIGAGAVVTKSVAACAVVAGNPACVISYKGSFDFVRYDNMDFDPARLEALVSSDRLSQDAVAGRRGHNPAIVPERIRALNHL